MSKGSTRSMGKRLSISLGFLLFVVAGFFITRSIIQWQVDAATKFSDDIINSMALAAYYALTGYGIYFLIIIATSIGGLVISRRLKDNEAITTFKGMTAFTIASSFLFFAYFFN